MSKGWVIIFAAAAMIAASAAPAAAGWSNGVLWAYGVPGVAVPYYQQLCKQKSYPPYYYTYSNVGAGQIGGPTS